jgi:hypothetical protein
MPQSPPAEQPGQQQPGQQQGVSGDSQQQQVSMIRAVRM